MDIRNFFPMNTKCSAPNCTKTKATIIEANPKSYRIYKVKNSLLSEIRELKIQGNYIYSIFDKM